MTATTKSLYFCSHATFHGNIWPPNLSFSNSFCNTFSLLFKNSWITETEIRQSRRKSDLNVKVLWGTLCVSIFIGHIHPGKPLNIKCKPRKHGYEVTYLQPSYSIQHLSFLFFFPLEYLKPFKNKVLNDALEIGHKILSREIRITGSTETVKDMGYKFPSSSNILGAFREQ